MVSRRHSRSRRFDDPGEVDRWHVDLLDTGRAGHLLPRTWD